MRLNRYSPLLAVLLLSLFVPYASAQQAVNPVPSSTPAYKAPPGSPEALISLLKVLDKVAVIIPGIGFKSFQLGQTRDQLIKLWGQPQQTSRKAVQYQLGPRTVIQFVGKNTIKEIIVIGQPGSVARVNNGASFGMMQEQVTDLFEQQPDKQNEKIVRYKALGIEFVFVDQQLSRIITYPAK